MSILKGWNAVATLKQEAQARKEAFDRGESQFKPRVFGLILKENSDKYPDNADVTFIDDAPTILPLVTYRTFDGKWETRRHKGKNDPINKVKGVKPKQTCLFSIIDHTPRSYVNKEGVTVDIPFSIRYLALSVNQADALQSAMRRLKKKLSGSTVNVSKSGSAINFLPIPFDEETHAMPEEFPESLNFEEIFPADAEAAEAGVQPDSGNKKQEDVKY